MKRLLPTLVAAVAIAGCQDRGPPAVAYRSWKDRLVTAAGLGDFFWPCYVKHTSQYGEYRASIATDQCFKMDPPKRWRGLYFAEFEGSRFCPAPARECTLESPGEGIWLEFAPGIKVPGLKSNQHPGRVWYVIDLIGRRTASKVRYGRGLEYVLIADKVISMKQVAFQPEMTQAEYDAAIKRWTKAQKEAGPGSRPG